MSKLFCSQDPPVLPVGQFSEKFVHFITQWWVSCCCCLTRFVSRKKRNEIILINTFRFLIGFCLLSVAVDCVVYLLVIVVCISWKEHFTQKLNFSHHLLNLMPTGSRVKFPQNISRASEQNNIAAFSQVTEVDVYLF